MLGAQLPFICMRRGSVHASRREKGAMTGVVWGKGEAIKATGDTTDTHFDFDR